MRVRLVEHKTSSEDIGAGSAYWRRLILDAQISTYMVGARALGFEPIEMLYDVAKRPALRPYTATPMEDRKYTEPKSRVCKECKKKAPAPLPHIEQLEDGREVACVDGRIVTDPGGRLYANMREHDETPEEFRLRLREDIASAPEKYYQRGTIVRLAEEERSAAKDAWTLARWIRETQLEGRNDPEAWPRNVDACNVYGSQCDFWGVCSGQLSLTDPLVFRRAEASHEELGGNDGKKRLPLVTMSSMKTFRSCPRKYYYRYELGYRPVDVSDALRFGTLFHKGLEVWWKTVDLAAAFTAMAGEADAFERVKAEELLCGYDARWRDEPLTVVAVEAEFVAPLVNPATGAESKTFQLGGKIDAIVSAEAA